MRTALARVIDEATDTVFYAWVAERLSVLLKMRSEAPETMLEDNTRVCNRLQFEFDA